MEIEEGPYGHNDPKNWKWGVFYYNPNDPRLLPPRRLPGLGYTVNFAHRRSVLLIIATSLLVAIIASVLTYFL